MLHTDALGVAEIDIVFDVLQCFVSSGNELLGLYKAALPVKIVAFNNRGLKNTYPIPYMP